MLTTLLLLQMSARLIALIHIWQRFWLAVTLWRILGRRWRVAWHMAARRMH